MVDQFGNPGPAHSAWHVVRRRPVFVELKSVCVYLCVCVCVLYVYNKCLYSFPKGGGSSLQL